MAQKVNIVLVDDIDGSEAHETVAFGLDGTAYEIDLNDTHAAELRGVLAGYVGNGRKVAGTRRGARRGTSAGAASSSNGASAADVRAWARDNGHDVPDRGRIPAAVRDAYEAAH